VTPASDVLCDTTTSLAKANAATGSRERWRRKQTRKESGVHCVNPPRTLVPGGCSSCLPGSAFCPSLTLETCWGGGLGAQNGAREGVTRSWPGGCGPSTVDGSALDILPTAASWVLLTVTRHQHHFSLAFGMFPACECSSLPSLTFGMGTRRAGAGGTHSTTFPQAPSSSPGRAGGQHSLGSLCRRHLAGAPRACLFHRSHLHGDNV